MNRTTEEVTLTGSALGEDVTIYNYLDAVYQAVYRYHLFTATAFYSRDA